ASDPCYILYTSGSTATAKGVVLAHGSVVENGFNIGERQHLTAADRVWLAVPLFWSFGSANALPAIVTHGGSVVLQESFEPGVPIRVVDPESGRALPPGDVGEFRVKGHVTPGYYADAEQTRAAFDAEVYFVTGDLGLIGADGRVRFRGRLKEMIKTGGINVA